MASKYSIGYSSSGGGSAIDKQSDEQLMGEYMLNRDSKGEEELSAIDEELTNRGLPHDIESSEWSDMAEYLIENMAYQIKNEDEQYNSEAWDEAIEEFVGSMYMYDNEEVAEFLVSPEYLKDTLVSTIEEL